MHRRPPRHLAAVCCSPSADHSTPVALRRDAVSQPLRCFRMYLKNLVLMLRCGHSAASHCGCPDQLAMVPWSGGCAAHCCSVNGFVMRCTVGRRSRIKQEFFLPFWVPRTPFSCGALGGLAGLAEDYSVKLAYEDTNSHGLPKEVELWDWRVVRPALLTFVHPILAFR